MNQSNYIRELKQLLQDRMPTEELKEVLSDYSSFFNSGREEGRSDQQIAEELGTPAMVAQSLIEDQEKLDHRATKKIADPGRRFFAFIIDAFISICPSILASFFISSIIAPALFVLFTSYPSPALGLSVYVGTASYYQDKTVTVHSDSDQQTTTTKREYGKPSTSVITISYMLIAFYLLYGLICTWLMHGQTVGKKLMCLRVRAASGEPASKSAIFYREFLGKTVINSIPIIPLISLFTLLFTKEHKALHDMLADTRVIKF